MTTISEPFDRNRIAVPLAIPNLISTDLTRATDTDAAAGFTIFRPAIEYAILQRDGIGLHISHVALTPTPQSVTSYLRVANVERWYTAFETSHASKRAPPNGKPWGMRECHVIDSEGNFSTIGQPLSMGDDVQ